MEYRTDGDKAVEHEEWPISSFGMSVSESVSQSVTMIIARDASASENLETSSVCPSHPDKARRARISGYLEKITRIFFILPERLTWKRL